MSCPLKRPGNWRGGHISWQNFKTKATPNPWTSVLISYALTDQPSLLCKLLGCNMSLHCLPATNMTVSFRGFYKTRPWDISWVQHYDQRVCKELGTGWQTKRVPHLKKIALGARQTYFRSSFSCIFSTREISPWLPSLELPLWQEALLSLELSVSSPPQPFPQLTWRDIEPSQQPLPQISARWKSLWAESAPSPVRCWDRFRLSTLYLLLGRETQICRCLLHSPAVESLLNNSALPPLRTGHLVSVGCCLRQKTMWDGFRGIRIPPSLSRLHCGWFLQTLVCSCRNSSSLTLGQTLWLFHRYDLFLSPHSIITENWWLLKKKKKAVTIGDQTLATDKTKGGTKLFN